MMALTSHINVARGFLEETMGVVGPNYPYTALHQFAIAVILFFPALAAIAVGLRMYIRTITKTFGWDDGLIVLAMLFSLASVVPSYFFIKSGYIGIHTVDVPKQNLNSPYYFWSFLVSVLYQPILSAAKASALLFMLRLGGTKKSIRYAGWGLMIFNILMGISLFFASIFQCNPVSYFWHIGKQPKMEGTCFKMSWFSMWSGGLNIATDVATLALPFILVLSLRMHRRVKIALIVVFSLGITVTIMSVVRLFYLYRQFYKPETIPDKHYTIGFVTAAAETNLAIVTACGPALWPLARKWFPGFFSRMHISQAFRQDGLPDIKETASDHSGESMKELLQQRRRHDHERNRNASSKQGFPGQRLASHTVGGTGAKSSGRDGARRTSIQAQALRGSQEEMVARAGGIVTMTNITVHYDDAGDGGDDSWPRLSTAPRGEPDYEDMELEFPEGPEPAYLCDYHAHVKAEARRSRSPPSPHPGRRADVEDMV